MPWSGRSHTTCPGRDAVIRHALVGTQLFNMSWSGRSFTTCPDRDAVIRHALVGTQLYDMTWPGRSYSICPGRAAVIRHALVGTQLYDMPWSGRSYTTCPGRDAVLRHDLVRTQLFNMSWSGCSFTCPEKQNDNIGSLDSIKDTNVLCIIFNIRQIRLGWDITGCSECAIISIPNIRININNKTHTILNIIIIDMLKCDTRGRFSS